MEYTNINVETNKKWDSMRSETDLLLKKSRLAELSYMRELFSDQLPIGDDLTHAQSYLDNLEQIIEKNGPINNEQFDAEQCLIDPETNGQIAYKYNSASLSHERAQKTQRDTDCSTATSILKTITSGQDMDSSHSSGGCDNVQDQPTEFAHIPYMAFDSQTSDSSDCEQPNTSLDSVYRHIDNYHSSR